MPIVDPNNPAVNGMGLLKAKRPPQDMTNLYNTQLTPEEEQVFLQWQSANPGLGNTYDYDSRGFWKSGAATSANNHGADTWKKPNHPTFSSYSQYNGVDGYQGGNWNNAGPSWTFTPSQTNVANMPLEELQRYFQKVEPGNVLFSPFPGQ